MKSLAQILLTRGIIYCVCILFINNLLFAYDIQKLSFEIRIKDEINSYKIFSVYVVPGKELTMDVHNKIKDHKYSISSDDVIFNSLSDGQWKIKSPEKKGIYNVVITNESTIEEMEIKIFVLVPISQLKNGKLNNYNIGEYPGKPLKGLENYKNPKGFIEITEENENTYISPHFQLKQFLCKQAGNYPKYIILKERLILKLELILEKVNEKGYTYESIYIMSGYRTPYYNKLIRNVQYSRHIYGDSADIFLDNDNNGRMDDMNDDSKIDEKDISILYKIIDDMYGKSYSSKYIGGLAKYKKNTKHAGFVHIDTRGTKARW